MMDRKGTVVGIEHIQELTDFSIDNLKLNYKEALENKSIVMVCGDGRLGYPELGPYNAIHVGAAAPTIPEALVQQLAPGGKMIIPVGPSGSQEIMLVRRDVASGKVTMKSLLDVRYVPLTSKDKQWGSYHHKPAHGVTGEE